MKRDIVKIDHELCNGCGECIPNCHEGALQIIDEKAVLVSELMCDGLGACIGHCPEGAITVEQEEAQPYDEIIAMKSMVLRGENTVKAHLQHMLDYDQDTYFKEGIHWIMANKANIPFNPDELIKSFQKLRKQQLKDRAAQTAAPVQATATPKPAERSFSLAPSPTKEPSYTAAQDQTYTPTQWPVQMHLINPSSPQFQGVDMLLSADCALYSVPNFHTKYLKDKKLGIACPKLDSNIQVYIDKLKTLINEAKINTLTVIRMEVPCCNSLVKIAAAAIQESKRKIPLKAITISAKGEELNNEWL